MDFHVLSRKELQTLCKSNGIPANRSNIFMADALAKKRIPLSENKARRVDRSTERSSNYVVPVFGSAVPLAKKSNVKIEGSGAFQKAPVYTNNFLRKGKRKDAPPSHSSETDHEVKPSLQSCRAFLGDARTAHEKSVKTGIMAESARTDQVISTMTTVEKDWKVEPQSDIAPKEVSVLGVGTAFVNNSSNSAKARIVDKVRSQIESSLYSKVLNPTSNTAGQIPLRGKDGLASSPGQRLACLESPLLSFSPLIQRVGGKVDSIVDRVHRFWKPRDFAVVNGVSSPM